MAVFRQMGKAQAGRGESWFDSRRGPRRDADPRSRVTSHRRVVARLQFLSRIRTSTTDVALVGSQERGCILQAERRKPYAADCLTLPQAQWASQGTVTHLSSDVLCMPFALTIPRRLIRWTNAPTTGLELVAQNILKNHQVRLNMRR